MIEAIAPEKEDEIVFLGDYIDRGPDSRDVVQQVIDLRSQCRVVPLRGNHEIMLSGVLFRDLDPTVWLGSGGKATITSYGGSIEKVPPDHRDFLQHLRPYYETRDSIFVHAAYDAHLPMHQQDDAMLYWHHLTYVLPAPHVSGKRVFVGHTPQENGRVLHVGHIVCMDTNCCGCGYLTAMNVDTEEVIQVNRHGHLLRSPAKAIASRLSHWFLSARKRLRAAAGTRRSHEVSKPT
jgi:serine/threonine protein phosphatase 1